jgi:F-type H+-transporting ATPase subunit gamma
MPTLKELKTRIASVKSTEQITRAMKLVAAAKMKRAIENALASRPYSDEVTAVLQSLMARVDSAGHDLLAAHDEVKTVAIVVVSADRGLCGGFNNGLFRTMERWLDDKKAASPMFGEADYLVYGKKARDFLRRRDRPMGRVVVEMKPDQFGDEVAKLVAELSSRYIAGEIDEVWLVYNRFINTLRQDPTIEQLFPLTGLADGAVEPERLSDFVYEPDQQAILNDILPLFLRTRITQVFLESEAGEHAARMTAMDSASRNARDVIDSLTLQYNRARQAAITRELVEIVAGAEAL